jgi:hypothetical protein
LGQLFCGGRDWAWASGSGSDPEPKEDSGVWALQVLGAKDMARTTGDTSDLAPHSRAVRYRELAVQALGYADRATTAQMRDSYILLAEYWNGLANDIDVDPVRQAESEPYPSGARPDAPMSRGPGRRD